MKRLRLDFLTQYEGQLPVEYLYERATIKSGCGLLVHQPIGKNHVEGMKTVRITESLGGGAIGRSWVADVVLIVKSTGVPGPLHDRCYDIFYQNAKLVPPLDRSVTRNHIRLEEYSE